jgi:hypothetical protein
MATPASRLRRYRISCQFTSITSLGNIHGFQPSSHYISAIQGGKRFLPPAQGTSCECRSRRSSAFRVLSRATIPLCITTHAVQCYSALALLRGLLFVSIFEASARFGNDQSSIHPYSPDEVLTIGYSPQSNLYPGTSCSSHVYNAHRLWDAAIHHEDPAFRQLQRCD